MIVMPAIDLKNGKCVRLTQGRADRETVYRDDPAALAREFQEAGAKMIHLVDLDGAFRGESGNLKAIRAVRTAVTIPLEVGGGMRTLEDVDAMLDLGIESVVVGTMAVHHPEILEKALARHSGDRVQLGVDSRDGWVAVAGWAEKTNLGVVEFAAMWRNRGITRVIFTDISRDGMMGGPNLPVIEAFARNARLRVTASGGVSNPEDLAALRSLEPVGVDRAIVGKALYEGAITLAEVV